MKLNPDELKLKDTIRYTFAVDTFTGADPTHPNLRSGEDRRRPRPRRDTFIMACRRWWFIFLEMGHAHVNVPKEFMTDVLKVREARADKWKYPLAIVPLVVVYVLSVAGGVWLHDHVEVTPAQTFIED